MVRAGKRTRDLVWLRLHGYQVVALKPELNEHTIKLENAIQKGIAAYPDPARADFYDAALEEGEAYIHVYRDRRTIYLVAVSLSGESARCRANWQYNSHDWQLISSTEMSRS